MINTKTFTICFINSAMFPLKKQQPNSSEEQQQKTYNIPNGKKYGK